MSRTARLSMPPMFEVGQRVTATYTFRGRRRIRQATVESVYPGRPAQYCIRPTDERDTVIFACETELHKDWMAL